ncbi:MAG: phosphoenolpyruvate kinase [Candidatus Solibacter usitatus]|nr:phosphoenolpyruvate kinase [Candidatus Solibacter usitatus]
MPSTAQPIHTVIGGAHLFRHDVAAKLGRLALAAFETHGHLLPCSPEIRERVKAKLEATPVEDYRIDFEDGYGVRQAQEENAHAVAAALEMVRGMKEGTLPLFCGVRPRPFAGHTRGRSLETLRRFFDTLTSGSGGRIPENFTVSLPKVSRPEEVHAFFTALSVLGADIPIEIMIETPAALRNIGDLMEAARGRCRAVCFGPYDFTSACGIPSVAQGLRHPLCHYARSHMAVALAQSGVWLVDGPTSVLPIGDALESAWQTQWEDIRNALSTGFFQGWDLHPAQLPLRYAAVFTYFQESLPAAASRMKNFLEQSAQATRVGGFFDDAATALGLRNFFMRAVGCGAITEAELQANHGLNLAAMNFDALPSAQAK